MIFYDLQTEKQQEDYKTYLSLVCSLSRLFSDSSDAYLYYRAAENIFCKAFNADNLSRSDCSADARKNGVGIGLKTFLHNNGKTFQKIAEFNSDRKDYNQYLNDPPKFIQHISQLRNERIKFTKRTYGIESMIYHCVTRNKHILNLYEMPMDLVDIDSIKVQKVTTSSIIFEDKYNEYNFNISKSTLFKRFITQYGIVSVPVKILEDPIELLLQFSSSKLIELQDDDTECVILPLYSIKEHIVPERSGLNQWNAQGRPRHFDEVYIPIPAWIHRVFKDFFPPRDIPFTLILPDKKHIQAKVCQDNGKALMSNPNKDLGRWLLRMVLQLKEGELLTYQHLQDLGIDSVRIDKIDQNTYTINFVEISSYDTFEEENKE